MIARHFPFFVAAAEEQSFLRAAERLHIAPSALSRRIADLEQELGGVALFERQARGARLTAAGRVLLEDARRILEEVAAARRRVGRVGEGELGRLRLSFTETLVRRPLLTGAVAAFRAAYPGVDLRFAPMTSDRQREAVTAGEIDLGFIYEEAGDAAAFQLRRVAVDGVDLVVPDSHPLAARPSVRLADLRGEPMIWPSRRHSPRLHDRLIAGFEAAGVSPAISVEAASVDAALGLVEAGLGVALVLGPPGAAPEHAMRRFKVEDLDVCAPLSAIWRDETSIVLTNFLAAVAKRSPPPSTDQASSPSPSSRRRQGPRS